MQKIDQVFSLLLGFDVALAAVLNVGPKHITHAKIELHTHTTLQMYDV